MANFLNDNPDLQYYLDRGIDWPRIVELTEFGFADPEGFENLDDALESYRDILNLIGEFAAEEIAPHAKAIDEKGSKLVDGKVEHSPEFEAIFKQAKELDLYGMCLPRTLGGLNCPVLLQSLTTEIFSRADVSVMAHFGFHSGIAAAMLVFSIMEGSTKFGKNPWEIEECRFEEFIKEILAGKAWGCMDITEPDAGSDMAALRTVGEQDAGGNWLVSGTKIFITAGHGKYHFVIARTEEPGSSDDPMAGLKGLSMFLVPAYDNDGKSLYSIDRIEKKLGHNGSTTANITFDKTPAYLVGERGEGFKYMLVLMNNARIGVGFECIGLSEAAVRLAKEYAAERRSMGKTIDKHEMIADYIDEMESDIIGLRALAVHSAVEEELAQKFAIEARITTDEVEKKRLEKRARKHKRVARRATPLLKYLAAEKAVEISRRCLQIHGGNGYMKEYGAEKLLRDALVMPIYEGTSQIQSLMAMKDTLGFIMANPQEFVRRAAQARWRSLSARDPLERRLAKIQVLSLGAQQHLLTKTAADKFKSLQGQPITEWPTRFLKNWDPKRDFAFAMLHAERLTELLTHEHIGEVLFAQATRHSERRPHLERYLDRVEARCRFLADEMHTTGASLLAKLSGKKTSDVEAAG
jgi:alkylation response protein AidB-like acyl-CoA dehydrogenase